MLSTSMVLLVWHLLFLKPSTAVVPLPPTEVTSYSALLITATATTLLHSIPDAFLHLKLKEGCTEV